jgi:tetratricopeptide (TPR) repeat protein
MGWKDDRTITSDDTMARREGGTPPSLGLADTAAQVSPPGTPVSEGEDGWRDVGEAALPDRGALIGRYVVLYKLGAGGMGLVLAAYDPELDRKVALKLLRPRARAGADAVGAALRLQREALALAKLNHANIVAVHDAGVHGDQVFVAMEFVEGQTLGAWLRARRRTWREVARVFEEAGRGLAHAHAKGLVHRDFKPDNVMLGEDGRVRVMDFGLVRSDNFDTEDGPPTLPEVGKTTPGEVLGSPLTLAGAIVGTPAYMAPEQLRGDPASAHSDQFGFCVALYEALYGHRPFPEGGPGERLQAIVRGPVSPGPRAGEVPAWLRKLVLRGLSEKPDARFADMGELLAALGSGDARRRRNRALAAIGGVAAISASVAGYQRFDLAQRTAACEAAGAEIDAVWDEGARARVRDGLMATGASFAEKTVTTALPWLDAHAAAWRERRADACMRAEVRGEWSDETTDKALWCLDEQRTAMAMLIEQLERADETVARRAVSAAAQLGPVATCTDAEVLAGMPSPPTPELRPELVRLRERLWTANTLLQAGKYNEALVIAREARAAAEQLAWPPLVALAWDSEAEAVLRDKMDSAGAERAAQKAYMTAAGAGDWRQAASSAIRLACILGSRDVRFAEARVWADHAAVAIEHAGDPLGMLEARRRTCLGHVERSEGNSRAAQEHYEKVVAIREASHGPTHPETNIALSNLAGGYEIQSDFVAARRLREEVVARDERTLGPDHPETLSHLAQLVGTLEYLGEYSAALPLVERVLAAERAQVGPQHWRVVYTLNLLGKLRLGLGEYAEAKARFSEAVALAEKLHTPGNTRIGIQLAGLASAHRRLGEFAEARSLLERALAIQEPAFGKDTLGTSPTLQELADLQLAAGEHAAARQTHERVLAIYEKTIGAEDADLAYPLTGIGQALIALGEPAAAIGHLERAVALRAPKQLAPGLLADSRFALAQALWTTNSDRPRARRLAEEARQEFTRNAARTADLQAVEAWLACARCADGAPCSNAPCRDMEPCPCARPDAAR